TRSEVAAEAVSARLSTILNEEPAAAPVATAEPEPAPAQTFAPPEPPAAEFSLTPPPEFERPQPEPLQFESHAATEPASAPLSPGGPLTFDDYDSQQVAHHDFETASDLDEVPLEPIRRLSPVAIWLGLIIVGLIIFSAGIFWVITAKPAAGGGFPVHTF